MKHFLLVILLSCTGMSLDAASLELPQEFTIQRDWERVAPSFVIKADGQLLGTAVRRFYRPTPTYTFCDSEGHQVATGEAELLSLFTKIHLTSSDEQPLGHLEEEFNTIFPTFRIIDANGSVVARARLNFWATRFTITDPDDDKKVLASISRSFFRMPFKAWRWTVRIEDDCLELLNEHALLFSLVAVYQSDRERLWQAIMLYENGKLKSFSPELFSEICFEEEDEAFVMDFVDHYLEQFAELKLKSPEERFLFALERLEPLMELSDETLSPQEKAALCYLLEQHVHAPE